MNSLSFFHLAIINILEEFNEQNDHVEQQPHICADEMCFYVIGPLLILSGDCWGWELLLTGEGGELSFSKYI
jgi:hypothetical protein